MIECLVMAFGLMCFDGKKSPGAYRESCDIPKEVGYLACVDYPNCNIHGWNLAYVSETYVKENKVKWCEEIKE